MLEKKREYRIKQGLSYMPLHCSEMRDLDIGALVQQFTGTGWQVYKWIELLCIEKNGYYLDWTQNSPKTVAHVCYMSLTQKNINFISEVLSYCLAKGFFDKTLFKEKNVVTSRYLQERFLKVLIDCNRKLIPILPEINLIPNEIKAEFKQENPPNTKIYENSTEKAVQNLTQDFENPPQDLQQKEIKEKEKKKNISKSLSVENSENLGFSSFWDLYDKKNSPKEKVLAKWCKLTNAERDAALAFVPLYKEAQPDKTFRCNPYRYLNEQRWEQELIYSKNSKKYEKFRNGNNPSDNSESQKDYYKKF
ncbi:MAG: DUF4373 domain-containing protein [Prevotellaceae bacterium]|jgi:hypothetical protein|nr:DUF4373 domain-containing protein [Prevotellaceae bacterium]